MNINVRVIKRNGKFIPQASTGILSRSTGDDLFSKLFGEVFQPTWRDIINADSKESIICDTIEEAMKYAERYKSYYTDEIVWTDEEDEEEKS